MPEVKIKDLSQVILEMLASFCKSNGTKAFASKITGIIDSMTDSVHLNALEEKAHNLHRKIYALPKQFPDCTEVGLANLLNAALYILQRETAQAQDALTRVELPEELLNALNETMAILPERYQNLCCLAWDRPEEVMVEDALDYQVGKITFFNPAKKLGYLEDGTGTCFFHVCQIPEDEQALRSALANEQWQGVVVSYLYGENTQGKAATDLRLHSELPDVSAFKTGTIATYDVRKEAGFIRTEAGTIPFQLSDMADPFLTVYYQCGFPEQEEVYFQLKEAAPGKKKAFNIRHISTVGETTNVPKVGAVSSSAIAKWCRLDEKKALKDPFTTDFFYPLPLYDFTVPESEIDAQYKAWRETSSEEIVPVLPHLEPFKGTLRELRDCISSEMSICETRLKNLFAFEFPMVEHFYYSDLEEDPKGTMQQIRNLHPELARLSYSVLETNGKNRKQANPSLLGLFSLGFVVACINEHWSTRFARYFRPVGYKWSVALAQIAKIRNAIYHEYLCEIPKAELEETRQFCNAFLHM